MRTHLVRALLTGMLAASALALPTVAAAIDNPIDFDLRTWEKFGQESEGTWEVSADGDEVIQTSNDRPSYFVSPEVVDEATITGRFEVQTTSDDDLIGFVIGYSGPTDAETHDYDHLLLDWKQRDQSGFGDCVARAGLTLTRIDAQLTEDPDEREDTAGWVYPALWCHEQNVQRDDVEVLATDWGPDLGWEDNTEYAITVDYSPTRVRVLIDGELIFDVAGEFPPGRFGFYNYSQPDVRYSGFTADELAEPAPPPNDERLDGDDRFETSVQISQDSWEDRQADAVVIARADVFADSLAGTPLAVDKRGPLLITRRDQLLEDVSAEIQRVLGPDLTKTVYLLGGEAALDADVQASVQALGYEVVRVAGDDRIETAVAISGRLSAVEAVLLTDGYNFPDALAAGPAAANVDGAVLLTQRDAPAEATDAALADLGDLPTYAVGGPAADAYASATPIVGANRSETSVLVAEEFFDGPPIAGLARSDDFPDSLGGGAHIATGLPELGREGGPMLLTPPASVSDPVGTYLCDNNAAIQTLFVYGGAAAIDQATADAAAGLVDGSGC